MKYCLFIGRWSPFHEGHKYIIDSFVNNGKNVCIAVRDVGRNVGYGIIKVPDDIKIISGTAIREGLCDRIPEEVKKVIRKEI